MSIYSNKKLMKFLADWDVGSHYDNPFEDGMEVEVHIVDSRDWTGVISHLYCENVRILREDLFQLLREEDIIEDIASIF